MNEACEKLEGRTNSSTTMAPGDEFFPGMNLEASNRNKGQSSRPMTSIATLEVKLETMINKDSGKKIDTMANVSNLAGNPVSVVMDNTYL